MILIVVSTGQFTLPVCNADTNLLNA